MFVHLHTHSNAGSLADAHAMVTDLARKAKELGQPAFALTEHGSTISLVSAYKAAKKEGIKFIPGVEFYWHPVRMGCQDLGKEERSRIRHLTVLAKNEQGYRNILKLASIADTEGLYYKGQIDDETILQYKEGLIVLSGCPNGYIPKLILAGEEKEAIKQIEKYAKEFKDDFYLEIQKHPIGIYSDIPFYKEKQRELEEDEKAIANFLIATGDKLGIPIVLTNDVHYVNKEDSEPHDLMLAIHHKKSIDDETRMRYACPEFYLKSYEEMASLFPDREDFLSNTLQVANKCNVVIPEFDNPKFMLPSFPDVPPGKKEDDLLWDLCIEGLDNLNLSAGEKEKYKERMEYEFKIISQMGFSGYFLILRDIIQWGGSQGIGFGVGRGSAAGCLISYLVSITKIDSIKYDLIFERFLNPDRISLPDIDVDVHSARRSEIVDYIVNKYGENNVCSILTVSELTCKSALKKVMTAYDIPFKVANGLTDVIPDGLTIEEAMGIANVQKYVVKHKLQEIVSRAKTIEGRYANVGCHPAGVVISDLPISNFLAIKKEDKGLVGQGVMKEIEGLGFLKLDLLGLKTVDILSETRESIKRNYGVDIDWTTLEPNDPKVFEIYQKADTDAIFQMESNLFKGYLPQMQPQSFDDICVAIALLRPGCLDAKASDGKGNLVDEYIRKKNGSMKIRYPHETTVATLEPTKSIMVYQEQAMRIAIEMAGYTPAESDELRSIIGKKIMEKMPAQREKFINGAIKKGVSEDIASRVFDSIETMGGYSFNKSHSYAYGFMSYATAYFKTYYPIEFFASVLNISADKPEKLRGYLPLVAKKGIKLIPPSINVSSESFIPLKDGIMYSLKAINGLGDSALDGFLSSREKIGEFTSFIHFLRETECTKTTVESLIHAGAFDSLGYKRKQLFLAYEKYQVERKKYKGKISRGRKRLEELSLEPFSDISKLETKINHYQEKIEKDTQEFDTFTDNLFEGIPEEEYTVQEIMAIEKELMGFALTYNMHDWIRPYIVAKADIWSDTLFEMPNKQYVTAGGILVDYFKWKSARGTIAFGKIDDGKGLIGFSMEEEIFAGRKKELKKDTPLLISGSITNSKKYGKQIKVERFNTITQELINTVTSAQENNNRILVLIEHKELADDIKKGLKGSVVSPSEKDSYRVVLYSLEEDEEVDTGIFISIESKETLWGKGVLNVLVEK